jgi:hypothetical protein
MTANRGGTRVKTRSSRSSNASARRKNSQRKNPVVLQLNTGSTFSGSMRSPSYRLPVVLETREGKEKEGDQKSAPCQCKVNPIIDG